METRPAAPPVEDLAPVSSRERIEALDVIRGVALLGIFLMNIEWFNRAHASMGSGLPAGLTGADWWASRLIYVLVQGKFWTMFSLLFGMGFAVMLARAEAAGRDFLRPYLRRIAALALFGAAHHILLWAGDILFSYAVGALALLILLYGRWKPVGAALVALVGLGFLPQARPLFGVAGALAYVGMVALWLRGEKRVTVFGRDLPLFSVLWLGLAAAATLVSGILWLLPKAPMGTKVPLTVVSLVNLLVASLSARYHQPAQARPWRMGVVMYLLPFTMMTTFGVLQLLRPRPAVQTLDAAAARRVAERNAEMAKAEAEREAKVRTETEVMTKGTYGQEVRFRAREFAAHVPEEAGFATLLIAMFLLGTWFVRSGVMADTRRHLPLFRRLAFWALPFGVGLGILGAAIATTRTPGDLRDPFQVGTGLLMFGNLPACLGYVGMLVLMLHSDGPFSRIQVLAPVGRMALTTYLTQSLLSTFVFYGWGLGMWGLGRAAQVAYVFGVFILQVAFAHWWLARFQYGPMEWLWRAITYWRLPAFRRTDLDAPLTVAGRDVRAETETA